MSFLNKVVIVTGASSGIGAATAVQFTKEGAKVALVGRNTVKLNNVAKQCKNSLVIVADISKDEDANRIIGETVKHFGKLDVLVNNAGMGIVTNILSADAMATYDTVMSINLRPVVYLTHLAAPHLVKTKGNIINISSIAALKTVGVGTFSYSTSKAGLDHFSRSVAQDLAPHGVRVNVVNPGPVRTDIIQNMGVTAEKADAFFKKMEGGTVLKRVSAPEEIADVILFLASDKARGITGASFVSDNGMMVKSESEVKLDI